MLQIRIKDGFPNFSIGVKGESVPLTKDWKEFSETEIAQILYTNIALDIVSVVIEKKPKVAEVTIEPKVGAVKPLLPLTKINSENKPSED